MAGEKFSVTLQVVGSLKRKTVGGGDPEVSHDRLVDLLHWTWASIRGVERLAESLQRDWFPPDELESLERLKNITGAQADEHLLAIAVANLEKAWERGRRFVDAYSLSEKLRELMRALKALRDVYEHWEEQRWSFRDDSREKVRAAKSLVEGFAEADPWSVRSCLDGDFILADIISLRELKLELENLSEVLVKEWHKREENPASAPGSSQGSQQVAG